MEYTLVEENEDKKHKIYPMKTTLDKLPRVGKSGYHLVSRRQDLRPCVLVQDDLKTNKPDSSLSNETR